MDKLIERALEVCNNLRHCVAVEGVYGCRQCAYFQNGCRNKIMLDAVEVIERLIDEVDDG